MASDEEEERREQDWMRLQKYSIRHAPETGGSVLPFLAATFFILIGAIFC